MRQLESHQFVVLVSMLFNEFVVERGGTTTVQARGLLSIRSVDYL